MEEYEKFMKNHKHNAIKKLIYWLVMVFAVSSVSKIFNMEYLAHKKIGLQEDRNEY